MHREYRRFYMGRFAPSKRERKNLVGVAVWRGVG